MATALKLGSSPPIREVLRDALRQLQHGESRRTLAAQGAPLAGGQSSGACETTSSTDAAPCRTGGGTESSTKNGTAESTRDSEDVNSAERTAISTASSTRSSTANSTAGNTRISAASSAVGSTGTSTASSTVGSTGSSTASIMVGSTGISAASSTGGGTGFSTAISTGGSTGNSTASSRTGGAAGDVDRAGNSEGESAGAVLLKAVCEAPQDEIGRALLAAWDSGLLRALAVGSDGDLVPYELLRDCCCYLQRRRKAAGGSSEDGPWIHRLLEGSRLELPCPPPREKSPKLVARLQKLQEDLEWKQYSSVVQDVDSTFHRSPEIPFMATFRQQAAFGLNVVTLMVTGYIAGHVAMATLYKDHRNLHPVGGAVGLIVSMMVEVVLYVIMAERVEQAQGRKQRSFAANVPSTATGNFPSSTMQPVSQKKFGAGNIRARQRKSYAVGI